MEQRAVLWQNLQDRAFLFVLDQAEPVWQQGIMKNGVLLMNWTDERVELLRKLWTEGLSASQIATRLGAVSRNAVIGKAHRLKLSRRGKSAKAQPRVRKTPAPVSTARPRQIATASVQDVVPSGAPVRGNRIRTVGATALKLEFVADTVARVEARPAENVVVSIARRLNLLQLTENTCKWPMGDPLTEDFYFCGADSGDAGPYCGYHSKIAFQPVAERRRIKI